MEMLVLYPFACIWDMQQYNVVPQQLKQGNDDYYTIISVISSVLHGVSH